jgi:transcriptional regulator NrdR family protein
MTKVEIKRGLVCSQCGYDPLDVIYTRKRECKIVRLRQCPKCLTRFLTTERMSGTIAQREQSK